MNWRPAALDDVLALARHIPLFPCRPKAETIVENGQARTYGAKSPLTRNGFRDATQDAAQITDWWTRYPDALVGVPTGRPTGLVVIDDDRYKHDAASDAWIAEHTNELLTARIHVTGSDGRHFVYRENGQAIANGAGVTLDGVHCKAIDVRANGGYVIWWPLHGCATLGAERAPLLPVTIEAQLARTRARPIEPTVTDDPLLVALQSHGLYLRRVGAGKHAVDCPWAAAHTTPSTDSSTVVLLPHYNGYAEHAFKCQHTHCGQRTIRDLREYLGLAASPPDDGTAPGKEGKEGKERTENTDKTTEAPEGALLAFELEELLGPIPPERDLIAGMIPTEAYTVIAGALSSAKTTLLHLLVLSRASGYDLLDLGLDVPIEAGPCVLVSYEDSDARIRRRLLTCIQWGHARILERDGKLDADKYLARVVKNVRRVTLTGQPGAALVCRDIHGNAAVNTGQVEAMFARIKAFADRELMIGVDPLRLAFRGSQNDDDGADVIVTALNMLACQYPDSALVVPTHTTKAGAIEPGTDRTAQAYATSGSGLYSQHARSNFHLARPKPDDVRKLVHHDHVTPEEIEGQRITVLSHARLSHGVERKPLLYALRKGVLVPVPSADTAMSAFGQAQRFMPHIVDAVLRIQQEGGQVTATGLVEDAKLRRIVSRDELRALVRESVVQGWLLAEGTTRDKRLDLTDEGRQFARDGSRAKG